MIERATACLKSGAARDSLRTASQTPRSRRLLHSSFWNHGAGDLDLPPSLLPLTQAPADATLRSNNRRREGYERSKSRDDGRDGGGSVDGIFLDFLYPPQAIAWLQRANAQQLQRWERRISRRLPEGFVVASRRYASNSRRDDQVGDKEDGRRAESGGSGEASGVGGNSTEAEKEGDIKAELDYSESLTPQAEPSSYELERSGIGDRPSRPPPKAQSDAFDETIEERAKSVADITSGNDARDEGNYVAGPAGGEDTQQPDIAHVSPQVSGAAAEPNKDSELSYKPFFESVKDDSAMGDSENALNVPFKPSNVPFEPSNVPFEPSNVPFKPFSDSDQGEADMHRAPNADVAFSETSPARTVKTPTSHATIAEETPFSTFEPFRAGDEDVQKQQGVRNKDVQNETESKLAIDTGLDAEAQTASAKPINTRSVATANSSDQPDGSAASETTKSRAPRPDLRVLKSLPILPSRRFNNLLGKSHLKSYQLFKELAVLPEASDELNLEANEIARSIDLDKNPPVAWASAGSDQSKSTDEQRLQPFRPLQDSMVDPNGPDTKTTEIGVSDDVTNTDSSGDEPTAKPDADIPQSVLDPLQYLQNIMESTRSRIERVGLEKSRQFTTHVWSIYERLDQPDKDDVRLRSELLSWFSQQGNDVSDTRGLELFSSIEMSARNLSVYRAAMLILLRLDDISKAVETHGEALENIENGHEISRLLFRYAIEQENWKLAQRTQDKHSAFYTRANRTEQISIFWLHVSDIENLFYKTLLLARDLQNPKRHKNQQFREFCGAMFKVAIEREFLTTAEEQPATTYEIKVPIDRMCYLFQEVIQMKESTSDLLGSVLYALVRADSKFAYNEYHGLVSFLYLKYSRAPGVVLSEELLLASLRRLIVQATDHGEKAAGSRNIEIDTVLFDWKRLHRKLSFDALRSLLPYFAQQGLHSKHHFWWVHLLRNYSTHDGLRELMWTAIDVYARRADLDRAQQAFAEVSRIASESGNQPDLRCWNSLLDAHFRADDLEGGITNYQNLIKGTELTPDISTFLPIAKTLSTRGDITGLQTLMTQYEELTSSKPWTDMYTCLIRAYHLNGNETEAEKILDDLIPRFANGELEGSLTHCANEFIRFHAGHGDMDSVMQVYSRMKTEGIALDLDTYAGLLECLCTLRLPLEAFRLLRKNMVEAGMRPTAYHYALCINSFCAVGYYKHALSVITHMKRLRVPESVSSRVASLRAKAGVENYNTKSWDPNLPLLPLKKTIRKLFHLIQDDLGRKQLASDDRQMLQGYSNLADAAPGAFFEFLIQVHGRRQCFDAVRELYQHYMTSTDRASTGDSAPIRIITALMDAFYHNEQDDNVEACWNLVKGLAEGPAKQVSMPGIRPSNNGESEGEANVSAFDLKDTVRSDVSSTVGQTAGDNAEPAFEDQPPDSQSDEPPSEQDLPQSSSPAVGRQMILSAPFRWYLQALQRQNRAKDAITTFVGLLTRGYKFDSGVWNIFIRTLCQQTPPLALLAFVLTEQFLIPDFPGWSWKRLQYPNALYEKRRRLQHLRFNRQIIGGLMLPEYFTMVYLGGALLDLRQLETMGRRNGDDETLEQYIGTVRSIRERAPRTMYAVQSMPRVADTIQERVLRLGGDR